MPRRRIDRDAVKLEFLLALQSGRSVSQSAVSAGIHRATAFRWLRCDAAFAELSCDLLQPMRRGADDTEENPAHDDGPPFPVLFATGMRNVQRPSVDTHPLCPACKSPSAVRRVGAWTGEWPYPVFWRCGKWPRCKWASWRPRHPEDCSVCKGARLWSHSRKSAVCLGCGVRDGLNTSAKGNVKTVA